MHHPYSFSLSINTYSMDKTAVVNVAFVTHVLTLIEDDEQEDGGDDNDAGSSQQERLIELLIELNVHFDEQNIFIEALTQRPSHKHLTEYLLVLFNRAGIRRSGCGLVNVLYDLLLRWSLSTW